MTGPTAPRIMIDGELCAPGPPARPLLDDGLVRGDGVFEGLRAYARRPRTPTRTSTGSPSPPPRSTCRSTARWSPASWTRSAPPPASPDCAVRIMLTRGGQRIIREEPLPELPASWLLSAQAHRITPLLIGSKTLSYAANMQANRRAKARRRRRGAAVRPRHQRDPRGPDVLVSVAGGRQGRAPRRCRRASSTRSRGVWSPRSPSCTSHPRRLDDLQDAEAGMLVSTVMELQPVHGVQGVVDVGRRAGAAGRAPAGPGRGLERPSARSSPSVVEAPTKLRASPVPSSTVSNASAHSIPIARRVSCVALPRCGTSTTLSSPTSPGSTAGSCSNTSSAAPPMTPSRSARANAASSTTAPRLVLTSTAERLHPREHRPVE